MALWSTTPEAIGLTIRLAFGLAGLVLCWATRKAASNDGPILPLFGNFVGSAWLLFVATDGLYAIIHHESSLRWLTYDHSGYIVILGAVAPLAALIGSVIVMWLKSSSVGSTFLKLTAPRKRPDGENSDNRLSRFDR